MGIITNQYLYFLLLLVPLIIYFKRSLVNRTPKLKLLSFILRAVGIVLLILALSRPFYQRISKDLHTIFLVDLSESIDLDSVKEKCKDIRAKIAKLNKGDSHSVFYFANEVKRSSILELEKKIDLLKTNFTDDEFRKESKISSSLLAVRMAFPADKKKIIYLYSDGCETIGNIEKTVNTLKNDKIELKFEKIKKISYPEASIVSFIPNTKNAFYGEKVRFTAKMTSNKNMNAKLKFVNNGVVFKEIPIKLKKNKIKELSSDFVMKKECSSVWSVEIVPAVDHFLINNKASCSLNLRGVVKVLALHEKPRKLKSFKKILAKQDIEIETRGKFGLPETITEMLEFDAIILANIPAVHLTPRQMSALKKYVMDFGRGLIMTGSENSFGLGGYYKTEVEDVLPVVSRYEKEKEQPSMAMALVIDKSGSMGGQPIALARQAAKAAVELLTQRDKIAVIAFDGQPKVMCDMISAINTSQIENSIDMIGAGGGTNMYPAMLKGKELLEETSAKIKHMILLTDGQSSGGDFEGLAEEMSDLSMTVSSVALGQGSARELLNRIAEIGGGRYYETNDASSVPRIFTKETMEASRSAIKEEPFIPIKISETDYLESIDLNDAPYLLGYVMTKVKPTAKVQLITEQGDPLLAFGRFGLGKSIAFTSDITEQWASEWLEWNNFGKLWSQIIRSIIKKDASTSIIETISEEGSKIKINLLCKDDNGFPINKISWDGSIKNSYGNSEKIKIKEVGLGRYESIIDKPEIGIHSIFLNDKTNNNMKNIKYSVNYPKEYLLSSKPPTILNNSNNSNLQIKSESSSKSIENYFAIFAIISLLTGIFIRRI